LIEKEHRAEEEKGENKRKDELIEEMRKELEKAHEQIKDYTDKYIRALADMDNQRKRMMKDKEEIIKYANERLIVSILPVIDNFGRAISAGENTDNVEKIVDGVRLILKQLEDILEKEGVQSFNSIGEIFDPYKHEAYLAIESKEHKPSTIIDEIEKGYVLKDKIIRPARVTVAKQDEEKKEDDKNDSKG